MIFSSGWYGIIYMFFGVFSIRWSGIITLW